MSAQPQAKSATTSNVEETTYHLIEAIRELLLDDSELAQELSRKRYIVGFDVDGMAMGQLVPSDACIMSPSQLLKAINEPNGIYVSTDELEAFRDATNKQLSKRYECQAAQGAQQ